MPEADIAANDAIHGLAGFQVGDDRFDRGRLIRGFLEGETGLEGAIFTFAGQHARAFARGSARIQVQKLRGHVAYALRRLAARLLPLFAAELVQRRGIRRCSGVARDEMQRLHRNIQLVAIGIFEHQKLARVAGDVHGLQADVAADSVGLVHHRSADSKIRQFLEDLRRIAFGPAPAALLPCAIAEQLSFGENLQRRCFELEAGHGGGYRYAEFQGPRR